MNYKINKVLVNQAKVNFPWVNTQKALTLEPFIELSHELRLKALEGLENNLEYTMSVEITLSINDYSVRDQTIEFTWDITTIGLPVHGLLIASLLERGFKDQLVTENKDELKHWTWEVQQLLDELYQVKLNLNNEEVII